MHNINVETNSRSSLQKMMPRNLSEVNMKRKNPILRCFFLAEVRE